MEENSTLWYRKPAENFDEALPIGNGRLGGMVYGRTDKEIIHLNEDSVWSGGKRNRNNPNSLEGLPKVRELIKAGKIPEAEELAFQTMQGVTPNCRHYMPLGDLLIEFPKQQITNYKRSLDLCEACTHTTYTSNGVSFSREVFVSHPDQVLVFHMTSDTPHSIDLAVSIDGRDDYYDDNRPLSNDTIYMSGGCGGPEGIWFAVSIRMKSSDGEISARGMQLVAKDCSEVTIYLSARTNYYEPDYAMMCMNDVDKASAKNYDELYAAHLDDYQNLFFRNELHIGNSISEANYDDLATDERISRLRNDADAIDNGLTVLYYQFGRYLMISGSRPDSLPLNLQGIWNKDMWPAWGGRFTININTEMNYWPAEVCNLSECHFPLFDLIEKMRPNGRITAREMYDCGGFVAHHNTDLWGDCAPQDLWIPGTIWPMGAAWLCLDLYEHYRFTLDEEFLKEKYPAMKEAADFFIDYLIDDGNGHMVTCPSVSPENTYKTEEGITGSLCMGPSMDSEILFALFTAVINSSRILNIDEDYARELISLREKLPKPEIGKYGQIKEWAVDYDEVEIGHRHISQLFALHPGNQISAEHTPELAQAARATLERRLSHGGGHTGWSRAWIINFWARLLDKDQVYKNIRQLLTGSTNINLLDSHPPFQIDGNFGGTAGIAEALLQSQNDELHLLPALPEEWDKGYVTGLCGRNGFEVSISWKERKLTEADIFSIKGENCTIRYEHPIVVLCEDKNVPTTVYDNTYTFYTEQKKHYLVYAVSEEF